MKREPASRSSRAPADDEHARPAGAVILSPIGDLDPELLEPVIRKICLTFGFPVEKRSLLHDLEFALDAERDQYHSTPILEKLSAAAPADAVKVIGITRVDLFIPILTHVYGEAQLGGKACIVSVHRLDEGPYGIGDAVSLRNRAVKEAVHELGHTFKLRHCREPSCIMHYCRSVTDVDRKSEEFCRYCKTLLNDEMKRLADRE